MASKKPKREKKTSKDPLFELFKHLNRTNEWPEIIDVRVRTVARRERYKENAAMVASIISGIALLAITGNAIYSGDRQLLFWIAVSVAGTLGLKLPRSLSRGKREDEKENE
jgi:hypothetical protein